MQLIDLGPGIFDSATVDTNILIIQKNKNKNSLQAATLSREDDSNLNILSALQTNGVTLKDLSQDTWFIGSNAELKLREKIERMGKPLREWDVKINYGIKTGLNEAFIIDTATRDRLVAEDPKSAEILKPILRGRDIKRYSYEWAGEWLVATGFDIDVPKLYPAVFNHLLKFKEKAQRRDDQGENWWNLRACAYYSEFEKEKVVWKRIGSVLRFSYDINKTYAQDSTCIVTGSKLKFLCAYMNSTLGNQLLFDKAPKTGTGDVIVSVQALDPLPVPSKTSEKVLVIDRIEKLVDEILILKKENANSDISFYEKQIDQLVYQLYDLTPQEIAIVEGSGSL